MVLHILRRDLARLLRNPVALVVTIGVCIIPSLYAWYNVLANWDPYANTANIRIVVANEDAGTSNAYVGEFNAGAEVVAQLEENTELGWVFTSADEAREGVERGDYYAAIVIPASFSADLTSMLTGDFTPPELDYYVNEKKNAIAPKVTETGATAIQQQVNAAFVSTVGQVVTERLQGAAGSLEAAGSAAEADAVRLAAQIRDALARARALLDGMGDTLDDAGAAAKTAEDTMETLAERLPSLSKDLAEGDALLAQAREATRTASGSLAAALADGSVALGTVSAQAGSAVGAVTGAVAQAQTVVDTQLASAQQMIDGLSAAIEELRAAVPDGSATGLISSLEGARDELQAVQDALATQSGDITAVNDAVAGASSALDAAVQGGIGNLAAAQDELSTGALPKLASGLDDFAQAGGTLSGALAGLEPILSQASSTVKQLADLIDQARTVASRASEGLASLEADLSGAISDLKTLQSGQAARVLGDMLGMDAQDLGGFIAAPVKLETHAVYPVATYGSGVAPFYTNLALWVGGFVLIAIFKCEVDADGLAPFTPAQGYLARWLLFVLLAAVQALVVLIGDLALGVQCAHPALFVLAGLWTGFVYASIIYALAIAFRHIGKALGVILVIVQIPGSSGMYPIEMMPGFFQLLHPLLPFTYGINALREAIAGLYGLDYLVNLAVLGIFLALALVFGLGLRPALLNLNVLFDRELAATGVMVGERAVLARERHSLRTLLALIADAEGFHAALIERTRRFEHRYPALVRAGFAAMLGLPFVLIVLGVLVDPGIDAKIGLLVACVAIIIAADAFLIMVEYIRRSLAAQMRASRLGADELKDELGQRGGRA